MPEFEPGLTSDDAADRLTERGRNELTAAPRTPAWRRLAAQFRDLLILILLGAAVLAFVVTGELKTPLVVLTVVVLNAVIGFVQENRAEASLDALRSMLVTHARVRRDGVLHSIDAAEVVVGDVVLVEAGDRIPADGRLLAAVSLEVDESALTGESLPVAKQCDEPRDAPLAERTWAVHMNSTVTRGRAEYEVTATGMGTEIGRIADLLRHTETEKTPLQKQLDGLARSLAKLAGGIVSAVFLIGLIRGEELSQLVLTAVALAVAAIPEGLPAVTVVTLAIGVSKMAKRNAIVKRLASVETLGCTTVICSDKTGTLTMNEMTAVDFVTAHPDMRGAALMAMALCNDAAVRETDEGGWHRVGDPTETALLVFATQAGTDVEEMRADHPRLAEVPFDSAHKYMATVHQFVDDTGEAVVRVLVKGAPDVLLARAAHHGGLIPHHDRFAEKGLRVIAVAQRQLSLETWAEFAATGADPRELVDGLTLLALVGIVDPPRPEARDAIAVAHTAGIDVKMITGDHAATATSIGRDLGLTGAVLTGEELDRIGDDELSDRIDHTSVFARVSPEHKLRLVTALQRRGHVVAMTGDGVNDAPALKKADLGVAMGVTGTEVSKEAATMVLTDDNFATIIGAVERGRTIYSNIVKFVRFQLSTTLGFALVFLLAATFGIADGHPFGAIAILWVNMIMDGPPAMALGVDPADADAMRRPPRPGSEHILTRARWTAIALSAVVMAIGTLAVLRWAPGAGGEADLPSVAGTMAFHTFVGFQFFNILSARHDTRSVFHRDTLANRWLWIALAGVALLQFGVSHVGPLQRLFDTVSISSAQWLVCALVASSVLWAEEARKLIARRRAT
jgi:Ca2+-transporting ATPase